MAWIQNVAASDIPRGRHIEAGINAMLIQIVDPDMNFPVPKHTFKETHGFKFLDIDGDDVRRNPTWVVNAITDEDAAKLVALLKHAHANHMNVVVHCVAGICRSGAVVEVGTMMGFTDCENYRSPNLLVKHKMMQVLGLEFDPNEQIDLDNLRNWTMCEFSED